MPAHLDPSALSCHRLAKFALAFLLAIAFVACVTFTARAWMNKTGSSRKQDAIAAQPTPATVAINYVRRARLWPQLRYVAEALGDRLEKPGKERLILIGTLSRASKQNLPRPIRLVLEFPDRLRLEEEDGVTTYNNGNFASSTGTLRENEQAEVESLIFDFVDHFFSAQMGGYSTRFLGTRFRMDDGKNPQYAGPFYDLYQITDRIGANEAVREQPKLYFFNSNNLLLERVRYEIQRNGKPVKVETLLSGWQKITGQPIPNAITRTEDGARVLMLSITAITIVQKLNDGIFGSR